MRSTAPQVGTGRSLQVDTTDVIHSLGVTVSCRRYDIYPQCILTKDQTTRPVTIS